MALLSFTTICTGEASSLALTTVDTLQQSRLKSGISWVAHYDYAQHFAPGRHPDRNELSSFQHC
jgi:hypothetical protein